MRALESSADARRFEGEDSLRNARCRRRETDEVGYRPRDGSTAERAALKLIVTGARVMVMMRRHGHRHRHGCRIRAQFEQERGATRRHEADGNVRSEQQGNQQQAGAQVGSPERK